MTPAPALSVSVGPGRAGVASEAVSVSPSSVMEVMRSPSMVSVTVMTLPSGPVTRAVAIMESVPLPEYHIIYTFQIFDVTLYRKANICTSFSSF